MDRGAGAKRIFVAGATGVIGRRAIPLLVEAGHQVTAVGRTEEKRRSLERLGARAVLVDTMPRFMAELIAAAVGRGLVLYRTLYQAPVAPAKAVAR